MAITPQTKRIAEEFVLEMWWADEVSPARMEELLFNLIIAVIESYPAGATVTLLRAKPPVAMDPDSPGDRTHARRHRP